MAKKKSQPKRETRHHAREAVDGKVAKTVLAKAEDEETQPDDKAAEALREAASEETAEIAEAAARHARRRGRKTITADDVARANERHQSREERGRRR